MSLIGIGSGNHIEIIECQYSMIWSTVEKLLFESSGISENEDTEGKNNQGKEEENATHDSTAEGTT